MDLMEKSLFLISIRIPSVKAWPHQSIGSEEYSRRDVRNVFHRLHCLAAATLLFDHSMSPLTDGQLCGDTVVQWRCDQL